MDKVEESIEILKMYNQNHIINLLQKLEGQKRDELINQIHHIDFHQLMELYDNTKKEIEIKQNKIEAISYLDKQKMTKEQKEELDMLEIGRASCRERV